MIEKPTKKELIGLMILGVVLFIIVVVTALAISSFKAHNADAHMRNHSYPTPTINPCQEGLTWETESPCPTIVLGEPEATPEATPSAEPSPEVTTSPTAGGSAQQGGSGVSDGLHQPPDGLGCAVHECKAETPLGAPMTGRAK